ncbi:MAG: NAD(P)/FAD-dependent oxidoreductase [Ktedonobacteraceae bacterium]
METVDVIIVGAGANGTSTAFHLVRSGVKKVVVVERRFLGAGATGKSGAMVHTHYTNEPETRLSFVSLECFKHWKEIVGGDCGYQPTGLLVLIQSAYHAHLEANVAMHRLVGANVCIITSEGAQELNPSLWVGDVTHLAYEPESGFADPNATIYSFVRAATDFGVEFKLDTEVTRVLAQNHRVIGVETTKGTMHAPTDIIAAGALANSLFEPLGIVLGLIPLLTRVTIFRWAFDRSTKHLTYIDSVNHLWARPFDGNCTLVGVGSDSPADPNNYAEAASQDYMQRCQEQLIKRFPVMHQSVMRGSWAGMFMESPASRPIIGPLPPYQGLFCVTGDSGTSFKTSPAIGKCLAELVTPGKATTVDLTPFRATCFAEGLLWHDEFTYGIEQMSMSR